MTVTTEQETPVKGRSPTYARTPTESIDIDGTRFAYRQLGADTGVPVIFLNHLAAVLDNWDPRVIDGIAAKRRVIVFDSRGIGASGGSTPDSVEAMARDAIAFIRALGFDQVDLLGFSLGGMVSQVIAQEEPQLVRKLVLAGTGPAGGEGMNKVTPITIRAMVRGAVTFKDPKTYLFFTRTSNGQTAAGEFLKRLKERTENRDKAISLISFRRQLKAIHTWAIQQRSDLSSIQQPVLVANGDQDRMVPSSNSVDLARRLPNARLKLYPDAGHGGVFQYHQEFVDEALDFLGIGGLIMSLTTPVEAAPQSTATTARAAPTRTISVGGTPFAYRELGPRTGVPLVFLHHFTAVLDDWDPRVINGIAAQRQVIAFDNRGIGASGGSVPHTIDEMAVDAVAFIRALGYDQVDLLGFSLGGGVAQVIMLEHPELVRKAILAGTGPAGGGGIEKINRIAATAYTKAALTLRDPRHYLFFNRNAKGKRAATDYMARLKERTEDPDKRISLQARRAQLKAIRAAGLQAPHDLGKISQPVFVANGDNDVMVASSLSADLARRIPNAKLTIYPDSGHGGVFQYHREFVPAVLEFLEG